MLNSNDIFFTAMFAISCLLTMVSCTVVEKNIDNDSKYIETRFCGSLKDECYYSVEKYLYSNKVIGSVGKIKKYGYGIANQHKEILIPAQYSLPAVAAIATGYNSKGEFWEQEVWYFNGRVPSRFSLFNHSKKENQPYFFNKDGTKFSTKGRDFALLKFKSKRYSLFNLKTKELLYSEFDMKWKSANEISVLKLQQGKRTFPVISNLNFTEE